MARVSDEKIIEETLEEEGMATRETDRLEDGSIPLV